MRVLHAPYMIKISGLEHVTASKQSEVLEGLLDVSEGRPRSNWRDVLNTKYSKTPCQVLDARSTRLRRARGLVRPGAAGLLIGIGSSRVRDSTWMYLISFITTRIGVGLSAVQWKLPDCVVVRLQLYSARTFHVTLSPRIYKGGQGTPPNNQHLRQYKQPHRA